MFLTFLEYILMTVFKFNLNVIAKTIRLDFSVNSRGALSVMVIESVIRIQILD